MLTVMIMMMVVVVMVMMMMRRRITMVTLIVRSDYSSPRVDALGISSQKWKSH